MIRHSLLKASTLLTGVFFSATVLAHQHNEQITVNGSQRCISGNGLPSHSTGSFPNRGNPHSIQEQHIHLCFDAEPVKNSKPNMRHRGSIGVALNGVQIRPGTADYYDGNSPRGFSRDRSSGWNLEGIGAKELLGMDQNFAHVDERGLYHYHGVSNALTDQKSTLIGYAADGFVIHYVGTKQTSSYQLKNGYRPQPPGGKYDGTYVEDWQYQAGSGSLDQCNGGMLNGKFVYFATKTYPFFPRCFWGNVSADFATGQQPRQSSQSNNKHSFQQQPDHSFPSGPSGRKPPTEAIQACQNKSNGSSCSFTTPRGHQMSGRCNPTPMGSTACIPSYRP